MAATKNPDTVFSVEGTGQVGFDDMTERHALKMTSLGRASGGANWELITKNVLPARTRENGGLTAIVYKQELEASDAPIDFRRGLRTKSTVKLGKSGEGEETRVILSSEIDVYGTELDGTDEVHVGRMCIDHVFTRLFAPPEQRRVRALDPELGFSAPLPEREIPYLEPQVLLQPPEGFAPRGQALQDGEPHVWPYANTDPNLHVHMMDYVKFGMTFAADKLAEQGTSPTDYFFKRCRVIYRRPFFTGDPYHRAGQVFALSSGKPTDLAVCAAFYRTAGAPPAGEKPAVSFQLLTGAKPHGGIVPKTML